MAKQLVTRPAAEPALAVLLVLFYALLITLYVALDASVGVSLHPWFGLAYCLAGALPGLLIVARGRPRAVIVAVAAFALLVALAPALDFSSRKPFLRAASGVHVGMSRDELDARLAGFARTPSGAVPPSGAVTFRSDFGPGDSDSLTVTLDQGRVTASRLLLD